MRQPYQQDWYQMAPGVKRQIQASGDKLMAVHIHFDPGAVVALHGHPHEQISYVLKGNIVFTIDGEDIPLTAGDSISIPGNIKHMATAQDETLLLETFSPPREDFLAQLQRG